MSTEPTLTPASEVPPDVQKLCERIDAVSEGLPVLLFVPDAGHERMHPLVVVRDGAAGQARQIREYLGGRSLTAPSASLRERHDLVLEAIHAAADYLPTVVFLPEADALHPITLVPESAPESLQACYLALREAQTGTIGEAPIAIRRPA